MASSSYNTALEVATTLSPSEQIELATKLLSLLKKKVSKKYRKQSDENDEALATGSDSDAASKKRKPNSWILFAMRVEALVRSAEADGSRVGEKMHTAVVKQFASYLKDNKAYDLWTDPEILSQLSSWTPPAVSKRAAAAADGGSVLSLSDDEKAAKKAAKIQKMKATREANKAAKSSVAAEVLEKADVDGDGDVDEDEDAEEASSSEIWDHKGKSYLRSGNNLWDAETATWVGIYMPAIDKINTKAKEPSKV
jgi:hypothetical protein